MIQTGLNRVLIVLRFILRRIDPLTSTMITLSAFVVVIDYRLYCNTREHTCIIFKDNLFFITIINRIK